jgi:hypothetical protein
MLIRSFILFPLLAQTVFSIGSIRQGGLANFPTRQEFDHHGLEQRQLQVPTGSLVGSKDPRSLRGLDAVHSGTGFLLPT